MKLDNSDITSATWQKVSKWAEAELEKHRLALEGDKPEVATAKLRGQVSALRSLLRLTKETAAPLDETNSHLYPK